MNMADTPEREIVNQLALEASLAAIDAAASALSATLLTLARRRKEISDMLDPSDAKAHRDEKRWSCD